VWFVVSYGCGILFVEQMNKISIGGAQFGFWMAQQGSIYVFVVLIFVYVRLMNRLDREFAGTGHGREEVQADGEEQS
jgi:putative solute:sodium symporter small subunit